MVPGASLTKQHAKTSEMRRSVAMGEIISRRRCRSAARNWSRWRIAELELPAETGSSIVTGAHGCKTAQREVGFAVSVRKCRNSKAIHTK